MSQENLYRHVEKTLLEKMLNHEWIGGHHTAFENLPKGFPPEHRDLVLKVAKDLIKRGWLRRKPTSYGLQVSLDPKSLWAVETVIRDP